MALYRTSSPGGRHTLNGLSMLVHQGTIGFELWTGQTAPEAVMKEALRKAFEAN